MQTSISKVFSGGARGSENGKTASLVPFMNRKSSSLAFEDFGTADTSLRSETQREREREGERGRARTLKRPGEEGEN